MKVVITVSFITIHANRYSNRLLLLLRQCFLIPNRINEFMSPTTKHFTSYLNQFRRNLMNTHRNVPFQLVSCSLPSEVLESSTNINPVYYNFSCLLCCVRQVNMRSNNCTLHLFTKPHTSVIGMQLGETILQLPKVASVSWKEIDVGQRIVWTLWTNSTSASYTFITLIVRPV
jgi:hypothetical protein